MSKQKIKIIFLDAASVNLGDIEVSRLKRQGDYQAYSQTLPEEIVERASEAEIIISNKVVLGQKVLSRLPHLKLIAVAATGYNNIAIKAAKKMNIAVANVAGYSTASVSEQTLLFLLAFSHRFLEHHEACLSGLWSRSPFYAELGFPYLNLQGKILGILGYGSIGRQVARVARALGMKVLLGKIPGRKYPNNKNRVSLKPLCEKADYISLHCPLSAHTKHLINSQTLSWMKRRPCLLNLARGAIVDEEALLHALQKGWVSGYATDVLEQEPPPANHPFFAKEFKNKILFSPHIAWASRESRQKLVNEIAANIEAFKRGIKRNRVC
ncbi:MAG: D-2-hydroxyacid dehydrogenase [Deltaproteobacteria bacterium]|nr:D-2-hydroxyacid dehydrogenase [Deltaproteobacteria bacterium]